MKDHDLFIGLAGLRLDTETVDLGEGVMLRRIYSHFMAPFLMAFNRPLETTSQPSYSSEEKFAEDSDSLVEKIKYISELSRRAHPAPWASVEGGFAFDIEVELVVAMSSHPIFEDRFKIATTVLSLLRIWTTPSVQAPIISNRSLSSYSLVDGARFLPLEIMPRSFRLEVAEGHEIASERFEWVRLAWPVALTLSREHAEIDTALAAVNQFQFVQNVPLALMCVWGAIEGIFSPTKGAELRFRITALIAAYLEQPGQRRLDAQKRAASLYDARSSAAHGKSKISMEPLVDSSELLRRVLIRLISNGECPNKEKLERLLFGVEDLEKQS
jgi:hypothetical protein